MALGTTRQLHSARPFSVPRAAGLFSGWLEHENGPPAPNTQKNPHSQISGSALSFFFLQYLAEEMPLLICVPQPSRWILQEGCRLQTVQEGRQSVSPLKLQADSSGGRHTNKLLPLFSYCTCQIRQLSKKPSQVL